MVAFLYPKRPVRIQCFPRPRGVLQAEISMRSYVRPKHPKDGL